MAEVQAYWLLSDWANFTCHKIMSSTQGIKMFNE